VLALLLLSCTADPDSGLDDSATTVATADSAAPTVDTPDSATPTDSAPPTDSGDTALPLGSITGQAFDTQGAPLEDLRVTLCRGTCEYDDTAADGTFSIPFVPPDSYPMSVVDIYGERGLAIPLFLVDVAQGEHVVLPGDVVVPLLQDPAPMPTEPGEVEILPGLFLSFDPDELWLAPWEPADHLQGAEAPSIPAMVPFEGALVTWYLGPFKSQSYADMGLRVENRWGLAPGDTVRAWVCSYSDAEWADGGLLTVDDQGAWLTGGAIRELTTLVLVRQ